MQEVAGRALAARRRDGRVLRDHAARYGGQLQAGLVGARCGGYNDVFNAFVNRGRDGLETIEANARRANGQVVVSQRTERRVLRGIAAPVLQTLERVLQAAALGVLVVAHVRC